MLLFLVLAAIELPPIPPLPPTSWPAAASAEPFARALLAQVPPAELAQSLHDNPELIPPVLRNLGTALMSRDAALRSRLDAYTRALARATSSDDLSRLATIIMIDPLRYSEDAAFRERMNALIPRTIALLPRAKVRGLLDSVTPLQSVDFDVIDAIVPRSSRARRVAFNASLQMPDDSSPISASIYSLNSNLFSAEEAKRFLAAVHESSPKRRLIVLADAPMRKSLGGVTFIDTYSRAFTPWPRDPFIVARTKSGGVVFVNRPNAQPRREEDQNMARAIVQQWDDAQWTVAPIPFHNGNILLTPTAVWISIHTLEPRALALLGLDRVPVETFNNTAGIERYLGAVKRAATELHQFYHRPVRFVHPLITSPELMQRLGGGAGIDLDSVLTILPNGNALVGDINLGIAVARDAEWPAVRREYKFKIEPRQAVIDAQSAPNVVALQQFLNEVAGELQRDGMIVRRLPLLDIPASLLAQQGLAEDSEFLVTWNNVVLDQGRAEGFASLLTSADDLAAKTFAAAGYKLVLLPPLIRSIVFGGGYRCASNHVRAR